MKTTYFYNKQMENLVTELDKRFNKENLWEELFNICGRYLSLIKTSIDNLDSLYVDSDQLDEDAIKNLEAFAEIIIDYMDYKVNLSYPSNQSADWLIAFWEFKKIKWYLHKIMWLISESTIVHNETLSKLVLNFKEYTKVRDDSYEIYRKEKAEAKEEQLKEEEEQNKLNKILDSDSKENEENTNQENKIN